MGAEILPPKTSRNTILHWRGYEKLDEKVVISGHIDSWDICQGAVDDAGETRSKCRIMLHI